jgi:hypothetical protein
MVSAGESISESSNELANTLRPGPKPTGHGRTSLVLYLIILLMALAFLGDNEFSTRVAVTVIGVICSLSVVYLNDYDKRHLPLQIEAWERRNRLYNDGMICLNCGNSWIPVSYSLDEVLGRQE